MLGNLQELQLPMDLMTETNLSDIFGFFRKCHCPKLEKIFTQVGFLLISILSRYGIKRVSLSFSIWIAATKGTKDPSFKMFLRVPSGEPPLSCDFCSLKVTKMNNFKSSKNEIDLQYSNTWFWLLHKKWMFHSGRIIVLPCSWIFWRKHHPMQRLQYVWCFRRF